MKGENEATMMTLNAKIKKLEGELVAYKVAVGKEMLSATLNREIDVPKPKKFKRARSTKEVDNFL